MLYGNHVCTVRFKKMIMKKYIPDIIFIGTLVLLYFLPRKSEKHKLFWIIPLIIFLLNLGIRIYLIQKKHNSSETIVELKHNLDMKDDKINELVEKTRERSSKEKITIFGQKTIPRFTSLIKEGTFEFRLNLSSSEFGELKRIADEEPNGKISVSTSTNTRIGPTGSVIETVLKIDPSLFE
jgi:hypothetical protein